MKYVPLIVVIGFFCIAGIIGSTIIKTFSNIQVRYNCDMAEFHPDYPPEVKKKCREIRNENRSMQ